MSPHRPLPGALLAAGVLSAGFAWCAWRALGGVRLDGERSAGVADQGALAWRVDLNAASAAELELLPGLGPRLAERIVADRAARGPFESLAALTRVPGVGPATIEAIAPYVIAHHTNPGIAE